MGVATTNRVDDLTLPERTGCQSLTVGEDQRTSAPHDQRADPAGQVFQRAPVFPAACL